MAMKFEANHAYALSTDPVGLAVEVSNLDSSFAEEASTRCDAMQFLPTWPQACADRGKHAGRA